MPEYCETELPGTPGIYTENISSSVTRFSLCHLLGSFNPRNDFPMSISGFPGSSISHYPLHHNTKILGQLILEYSNTWDS